jgi:O-antigen ligase
MLGVALVIALLTITPRTPLGVKARQLRDAAKKHDYEQLFSERLLPSLAAVDMIRDHPLLGVGPGCFRVNFMSYRLRLGEHYPAAWTRGYPGYWSTVHDDHLQIAAETGLPGYALFLAAIFFGARLRGRRETPRPRDLETHFARALRLPLAALVFVLCLAQFPLELPAARLALITLGTLCIGWDGDHAAD